jgi:hypothetical protein
METIIAEINEVVSGLSEQSLLEIIHYASYIAEKERKHKAFVEETLRIEAEDDSITCNSVEEFMEVIHNAEED